MESYILSKSTYIRGLQCLKSLYLNKHRPYLRDKLSEEQLARFARGHSVGKLARDLFPGGVEIPRPSASSAKKTEKLIREGFPVIYEACFIYNEVIIAIDILVKNEDAWIAYEVKSSGVLSETYYNDAYLQNYVIVGSGLPLKEFFLIHRNLEIEIADGTDLQKLFIFTKLPTTGDELDESIRGRLDAMKGTLMLSQSPDIRPGKHCMYPYPCDFRGVCWKVLSEEEKVTLMLKES